VTPERFTCDGLSLSYVDAKSGVPVVFQHGLAANLVQVGEIFPDSPNIRRITVECRGHGSSECGPVAELAIATFADDVLALLDVLGIRRAVFGGISMGAAIAQRLTVRRPAMVAGLILVRPAWIAEDAPINMRPFAEVAEAITEAGLVDGRHQFIAGATANRLAREAPDNLASLLSMFERADPTTTAALLAAIARDGPGTSESDITSIRAPTLVVGNAEDSIHPLAYAERLSAMIPNARFVEITPKARDRLAHQAEVRAACRDFLAAVGVPS
jgi:pimeloyl-ACP methyl ester carboxylesterase